jgi:hypothetical protein
MIFDRAVGKLADPQYIKTASPSVASALNISNGATLNQSQATWVELHQNK